MLQVSLPCNGRRFPQHFLRTQSNVMPDLPLSSKLYFQPALLIYLSSFSSSLLVALDLVLATDSAVLVAFLTRALFPSMECTIVVLCRRVWSAASLYGYGSCQNSPDPGTKLRRRSPRAPAEVPVTVDGFRVCMHARPAKTLGFY